MNFEKWIPVDLLRLPAHVQDIGMSVYTGDNLSVRIGAKVTKNGADEAVTGTVSGYVILPNGATIATITGASSGNLAWIDLPENAFVLPGRIQIAIRVTDGTTKTVLLAATATVRPVATTTAYDPDGEIPTWDEIEAKIEAIDDAVEQASSMVSYVAQTGKTDDEKTQARTNIGAAQIGVEGAIKLELSGTYSGTRNVSVLHDFPVGDYIIQVDGISSLDTDDCVSMIWFGTSNNVDRAELMLNRRDTPELRFLHLSQSAQKMIVYASSSYAKSASDTFTFTNLRIWKVDMDLLRAHPITAPNGFRWTANPLNGHLFRAESGIVCNLDVFSYRPSAGITRYVSPTGNDSNAGTSAAPLKSIKTAINVTNAAIIRLKTGFYDLSEAVGHINGLAKSIAIVADDDATPVVTTSSAQQTFTKTSGQTYVYEAGMVSSSVWDISNAVAYRRVGTVEEVNATAATYCCDSSKTYVHTPDGSAPSSSNVRLCDIAENVRITASGAIRIYLQGITFCGGYIPDSLDSVSGGVLRVTSDGTNRVEVYAKDCKFFGGGGYGACLLEGAKSVLHNCEAAYGLSDGFGYHGKSSVVPWAVEINCEGHHCGVDGTTRNGSTVHSGGSVIRVNSKYHHNFGPNVADAQNNTESWNLGCQAYNSLLTTDTVSDSDFLISTDTTSGTKANMWVDSCSGYGSAHSLCANSYSNAYVRGCAFQKTTVEGHLESY